MAPFKLFYLVDDTGLSDASESFKCLLLLPAVSEKTTDLIRSWVSSSYLSFQEKLRNTYISSYSVEKEKYAALLADKERKLEESSRLLAAINDELEPILASSKYLVAPIILHKKAGYGIKYVVNTKCVLARDARKRANQIAKLKDFSGFGGYYLNQINWIKAQNLRETAWTLGAKLVINGEIKKHPCVMCPNALESLEGLCSFGGPLCAEKLTQIISPESKG